MGAFAAAPWPSPQRSRLAGSTAVTVDVPHNELTMKLQLPGNGKSLMTRLEAAGFAIQRHIGVSVPVRSSGLPELKPDIPYLLAEINASGHVSDAQLAEDQLTAVTGPSSSRLRKNSRRRLDPACWPIRTPRVFPQPAKGLYSISWSLIQAGLIAQDTPTLVALRGL